MMQLVPNAWHLFPVAIGSIMHCIVDPRAVKRLVKKLFAAYTQGAMPNPQLRLSVFREPKGSPRLRWPSEKGAEGYVPEQAQPGEWYEEVFHWALSGGEQVAPAFATALIEAFNPSVSIDQRHPRRLREIALDEAGKAGPEWTISMEPRNSNEEMAPAMVNASLALAAHLTWLSLTFEALPGAHIVIR